MNITVCYEPTAKELGKASMLFVEKKPLFLFTLGLLNLLVGFVLLVIMLKWVLQGLDTKEWFAALGALAWLLGRRRLNQWVLCRRMKRSPVVGKPLSIVLSYNGIIWSGRQLRSGRLSWEQVKYVFEAGDGFVLPNSFTQFLWLPFSGFKNKKEIDTLRTVFKEKKMTYRIFPRWYCQT